MNFSNLIAESPWLPEQGSTFAPEVDFLFDAILWISVVSFLGIVVAMVLFAVWYRRRPGYTPLPSPSHSTSLELVWTIVPSIILVWIFAYGVKGYANLKTPRNDAPVIDVTAFQFGWQFDYPNGDSSDTLHLSVNQPVQLRLKSRDVIHSFYVPEFRAKMDVMPGRYHSMWFEPSKISDSFRLYCTEYCGDGHSLMKRDVVVHSEPWDEMMGKYVRWRNDEHQPLENGNRLYKIHCSGCHSYDGKDMTGPTFREFLDRKHEFTDGSSLSFSDPNSEELYNYIRESILEPGAKIVAGRQNQMPSFNGKLKDEDIKLLIEFIKEVSDGELNMPEVKEATGLDEANAVLGTSADSEGSESQAEDTSNETDKVNSKDASK